MVGFRQRSKRIPPSVQTLEHDRLLYPPNFSHPSDDWLRAPVDREQPIAPSVERLLRPGLPANVAWFVSFTVVDPTERVVRTRFSAHVLEKQGIVFPPFTDRDPSVTVARPVLTLLRPAPLPHAAPGDVLAGGCLYVAGGLAVRGGSSCRNFRHPSRGHFSPETATRALSKTKSVSSYFADFPTIATHDPGSCTSLATCASLNKKSSEPLTGHVYGLAHVKQYSGATQCV